MCSLDVNRRQQTKRLLLDIHKSSAQLIVLAHDLFFLRDLHEALEGERPPTSTIQLAYSNDDFTDFARLNIEQECESPYVRHHRMIVEFVGGMVTSDPRSVAKSIRPFLEGYLHRRFPAIIPKRGMLGKAISVIRDSSSPSPLTHAQSIVDELREINDYAAQFHHDTNPGNSESALVNVAELKSFAQRALNVVYKGAP